MNLKSFYSMENKLLHYTGKFADIVIVSLLFILFSLPVITLIPACAAAYYASVKSIKLNHGKAAKEFLRSFRENLKQGALLTVIEGVFFIIAVLSCMSIQTLANNEAAYKFFFVFFRFMLILIFIYFSLTGPVLSRFEKAAGKMIIFILYITIKHFWSALTVGCIVGAAIIITFFSPIYILIAPGLTMLISSFVIEPVLKKHMPAPEMNTSKEDVPWQWQ